MNQFLIAYDIFDTKRLPKVKKIAYSFSLGGQRSALEAPLSQSYLKILVSQLLDLIKDNDKINIISFHGAPILLGKSQHVNYENKGVIIL